MMTSVNQSLPKGSRSWRKSRLAARILIRKEAGRMTNRDESIAQALSSDPEVTNRLIQQALYFLGIGHRKQAFDRELTESHGLLK